MIRVLLAARSPLLRARASALLAAHADLELIDVIRGSDDVLERIRLLAPDVLLLGAEMLDGSGRALLRALRLHCPLPVLLLVSSETDPRILGALEEGAADYLLLPALGERAEGSLRLLREIAARRDQAMSGADAPRRLPDPPRRPGAARLIVVGASTGGPRAVQALLEALPETIQAAVVVALHMPAPFSAPYVARLDRTCRLAVAEAADGDRLRPGRALIVPGGRQADLFHAEDGLRLRLRPRRPEEVHAPSVDHLMASAAAVAGATSVGVVLTGMGDDGARGLAAIRAAGGDTIAESERTALIFGMPREAIRAGAAVAVLPLDEIPAALLERCGVRPSSAD